MDKKNTEKSWDKKRLFIESIIAILCAMIGIVFGKTSSTYFYNGTRITQIDLNNIMLENSDLKTQNDKLEIDNKDLSLQIKQLTSSIEEYKLANKELNDNNKLVEEQLSDSPIIEYQNLKLSIDGEERKINENKSSVLINGNQYYSQDFVNNLLPDDKVISIKDNTIYIGKIIKDKCNLVDQQIIDKTYDAEIWSDVKDTYGNLHSRAIVFEYYNDNITFNSNREYTNLKFKIAVVAGNKGGARIQIETEQGVIFTSETITSVTEPVEIDIPINNALQITIKNLSSGSHEYVMLTEAVLYNVE